MNTYNCVGLLEFKEKRRHYLIHNACERIYSDLYAKGIVQQDVIDNIDTWQYKLKFSRSYTSLSFTYDKSINQIVTYSKKRIKDTEKTIHMNKENLPRYKNDDIEIKEKNNVSKDTSLYERSSYSVNRTRQTLFDLVDCNYKTGMCLLTLTYDVNKKLSTTKYSTLGATNYDEMLLSVKMFIERLKKRFNLVHLNYVWFSEIQNGKHNRYESATNNYHIHMIIFDYVPFYFGGKNNIDSDKHIQKIWGCGIAHKDKLPIKDVKSASKYIAKYVSKETCNIPKGQCALHSSRGLERPIIVKTDIIPSNIYELLETANSMTFKYENALDEVTYIKDINGFNKQVNKFMEYTNNCPKNENLVGLYDYVTIKIDVLFMYNYINKYGTMSQVNM